MIASGSYTFEEIRHMDNLELSFIDHYQQLREKRFLGQLGFMLGVDWDLNLIRQMETVSSEPGKQSNELFIPLAVTINPQILEHVRKSAGLAPSGDKGKGEVVPGHKPVPGEVIKSTAELSTDQFRKMLGMRPRKPPQSSPGIDKS